MATKREITISKPNDVYGFGWVDWIHSDGHASRVGLPSNARTIEEFAAEVEADRQYQSPDCKPLIQSYGLFCRKCDGFGHLTIRTNRRDLKRIKCPECKAIDSKFMLYGKEAPGLYEA